MDIYKVGESSRFTQTMNDELVSQILSKKLDFQLINFNLFVRKISLGEIQYIKDFPFYLKTNRNKQINLPIEYILGQTIYVKNFNEIEKMADGENEDEEMENEETEDEKIEDDLSSRMPVNMFMYNLIKYAIMNAENYQDISEAALLSISKLLKLSSIQILDLVIKTYVKIEDQITTFALQLPFMVESSKTIIQKKSLLKCISALSGIFPNLGDTFFNFFVEQLQLSDPSLKPLRKVAASAAYQIICTDPLSDFSKKIMKYLPFDGEDPKFSKYCFLALEAHCAKGNYYFDIPQLIDFACKYDNLISAYAAHVLFVASGNSFEICRDLAQYASSFVIMLQKLNAKNICYIINNVVKKGKMFADPFVPLINPLNFLYYESPLEDKIYITRTICLIILNARLNPTQELISVCDTLIQALELDDDIIIIIVETLKVLKYFNDDFHQALQNLSESDDQIIALHATSTMKEIDQFLAEQGNL
ncbi:hypothetical protein M9Y10_039107 [Tritrichomonas musculus]|uniref:Uncharacterized protein n=1 Tax=Tritrichomonas musculus TaxID=1915356 RepID=A0ABR2KC52_9EUKA